jgi:2-polyprenyl-3-methyl-5-hydroxy-6-metoxy-1,4-benzoquinol methylase
MPSPACPLCAFRNTFPDKSYGNITPGSWHLRHCPQCGIFFLHPMPSPESLEEFYDQDYYGQGSGKFFGPVERIVSLFRGLRANTIRRLAPSGPVLDVGCGRGLMLRFLKNWGYEVDGVELDNLAARRAEQNLRQDIFNSLDEVKSSGKERYQVICFWHSLEHLPEPGYALQTADQLLATGGTLVISAPHMASIQSRLSGKDWLHLDLPRHLVHFDMNRLTDYLEKRGYHVIRQEHFSQEYNAIDTLCYLYSVLGFHPLYPFELLKGSQGYKICTTSPLSSVSGLSLLLPLGLLALLASNLFSMLRSGSTVTLFLRKEPLDI